MRLSRSRSLLLLRRSSPRPSSSRNATGRKWRTSSTTGTSLIHQELQIEDAAPEAAPPHLSAQPPGGRGRARRRTPTAPVRSCRQRPSKMALYIEGAASHDVYPLLMTPPEAAPLIEVTSPSVAAQLPICIVDRSNLPSRTAEVLPNRAQCQAWRCSTDVVTGRGAPLPPAVPSVVALLPGKQRRTAERDHEDDAEQNGPREIFSMGRGEVFSPEPANLGRRVWSALPFWPRSFSGPQ